MAFKQFLLGRRFQKIKEDALSFYGNECAQCGCRYDLKVFYKTFAQYTIGNMKDLIVLCDTHGTEFMAEKRQFRENIKHGIKKNEVKRVSFRYVKKLLGIKSPPYNLIVAKKTHLKIKRELQKV